MGTDFYHVLGVMSGTSLDGIDLAFVQFEKNESWKFNIISAKTIAYPDSWHKVLKNAAELPLAEINQINEDYTQLLAEIILQFIAEQKIENLDAVCSHGHTVLHQPKNKLTLQIGNLPKLATLIQQRVVCDFRVQDVELGGQGAPLVPIGDRFLFSAYDYCLNLGGFANISLEENRTRIAYDICPANLVLNEYASRLGLEYDRDGKIAAAHEANLGLLKKLNSLPFYTEKPPKSLGVEWVKKEIFPLLEQSQLSSEEIIATFTEHIAVQLSRNIANNSAKKVLVTGGGTFNSTLIKQLQKKTKAKLIIPNNNLVEYKEALIFGFLGVLKLKNINNVLASVTGASKDHCTGKFYKP